MLSKIIVRGSSCEIMNPSQSYAERHLPVWDLTDTGERVPS